MTTTYIPRDLQIRTGTAVKIIAGSLSASQTNVLENVVSVFSATTLTVGTLSADTIVAKTVTVYNSLSSVPTVRKFHYDPVALTVTTFPTDGNVRFSCIGTLGTFSMLDGVACVAIENTQDWTLSLAVSHTIALFVGPANPDYAFLSRNVIRIASIVPLSAYGLVGQVSPVVASATAILVPDAVVVPSVTTQTQYVYVGRWLGSESFVTPLNFYVMTY